MLKEISKPNPDQGATPHLIAHLTALLAAGLIVIFSGCASGTDSRVKVITTAPTPPNGQQVIANAGNIADNDPTPLGRLLAGIPGTYSTSLLRVFNVSLTENGHHPQPVTLTITKQNNPTRLLFKLESTDAEYSDLNFTKEGNLYIIPECNASYGPCTGDKVFYIQTDELAGLKASELSDDGTPNTVRLEIRAVVRADTNTFDPAQSTIRFVESGFYEGNSIASQEVVMSASLVKR